MKHLVALLLTLALVMPTLAAEPPPRPLTLTVGSSIFLKLKDKQRIKQFIVSKAGVVRVSPHPSDLTTVIVTGVQVGEVRITLIGADGKREDWSLRN